MHIYHTGQVFVVTLSVPVLENVAVAPVSSGEGISEMKVNPQKDAESWKAFKVCMDQVTEVIPEQKHNATPLFLGATAGMRLLQ